MDAPLKAPACTQCGADNPPGSRFCNQCGSRLLEAPAPATEAAPRAAYTPRHLAEHVLRNRAALAGERKRVTVLFVDIKGSTRLAQQAGAEDWHLILDRYFSILSAAVHRHEGTVNQYTGDGIMALFGAPVAHEDHALRACRAALEMQRDVRRYADDLRLSSGLNLSIRAGLNTGEVIVGAIGDDLRMDYTAQGLTVHLAARMEQICEPGRIYATRHTAALVDGYCRLRDLGDMPVAGMETALRVYEVEAEGAARTRLERGLARGSTQFVGRQEPMNALRTALALARAGQGGIVAVSGMAGIGKSRLCHEFAQECRAAGIAVLQASAVPYAAALPLHPVQALLRQRLGVPEQGAAAELRRQAAGGLLLLDPQAVSLLPRVLEFLDIAETPAAASGVQTDRRQLFERLARLLPQAPAAQVLLVEDLHFADSGTEAFLDLLCAQVPATPTLLLLNFRNDYEPAWLARHPCQRLGLTALGPREVETLATELLGAHPSVATLPNELSRRSGGNPFYVEEAVQALEDTGHLQGERGGYRLLQAIGHWPIPDAVHALVAARVDRLPDDDKSLLQAAAIIGLEFDAGELAQLARMPVEQCEQRLATLQRLRFVAAAAGARPGRYEFCNVLTQDVVYRTQLEHSRALAHRRLAGLLETSHPLAATADETAPRIAHHWRRAGEWTRAAQWNLHAARWATNQGANAMLEQYRLAGRNLQRAERSVERDHLRVAALAGLVRMAQLTDVTFDEAQAAYEEARALAQANRDTAALAELSLSWAAEQLHRGDAEAGIRVASEAVRLAIDSDARELVHRFRLNLLLIYNTAGYPREGIAVVNEAAGDDWMSGPVNAENYQSRSFYSMMLAWLGRLPEAATAFATALAYSESGARTPGWLGTVSVELAWFGGDYTGILQRAQSGLERAESFGSNYFRAIALRGLGLAHVLSGDPATAVSALEQALPLVAPGANAHQFESNTLATLARALIRTGATERAQAAAVAAVESAAQSRSRGWEIMAWLAYLELPPEPRWRARLDEALARVDDLIEITGAAGLRPWWWLAQARWNTDRGKCSTCRERAIEEFARIGASGHVRRLSAQ